MNDRMRRRFNHKNAYNNGMSVHDCVNNNVVYKRRHGRNVNGFNDDNWLF